MQPLLGSLLKIVAIVVIAMSLLPFQSPARAKGKLVKFNGIDIPLSKFAIKRGKKPKKVRFFGYHFPPKSKKPSPYIVLVPGCSGLHGLIKRTLFSYAQGFVQRGYGALVIDIFRGTTFKHTCKLSRGIQRPGPSRSIAALSAAQYVYNTGLSDGRFGIVGQSQGGSAALTLSSDTARTNFIFSKAKVWFRAAVAFYPGCDNTKLTVPVLVMIGDKDDWTSSKPCSSWLASGVNKKLEVEVYGGAYHAFDIIGLRPQRYFGYYIKYSSRAAKDSKKSMYRFFDKHLAP